MPTTITPLPPAPNRAMDVLEFSNVADAWVAAISLFTTQVNAIVGELNDLLADVIEAVDDAETAASSAAASALTAIGVSNYKGEWSSLSGGLNIPAAASYGGQIWILKENVANVAAEVPGVSTKWFFHNSAFPILYTDLAAGVPSISVGTDFQIVIRNALGNTNPQEIVAPASPQNGAFMILTVENNLTTNTFNPNGATIEGIADSMMLDVIRTYIFRYINNTWKLL